jgi:hypothetical protein
MQDDFDKTYGLPVETARGAVLLEARQLITGDRNQTYGPPTQNFQNIADLLNVQFMHKLKDGVVFTPIDVAIIMIQVKLARMIAQPKRDNFVDIAGYVACAWECQEKENESLQEG